MPNASFGTGVKGQLSDLSSSDVRPLRWLGKKEKKNPACLPQGRHISAQEASSASSSLGEEMTSGRLFDDFSLLPSSFRACVQI